MDLAGGPRAPRSCTKGCAGECAGEIETGGIWFISVVIPAKAGIHPLNKMASRSDESKLVIPLLLANPLLLALTQQLHQLATPRDDFEFLKAEPFGKRLQLRRKRFDHTLRRDA